MSSRRPSPFDADAAQDRIAAVVRRIPLGCVATYGDVAAAAGLTGRARMVGRYLGAVDGVDALPWHRVIAAGGRIALPDGSASRTTQLRRLMAEGVTLTGSGRVDLARHRWQRGVLAPVLD